MENSNQYKEEEASSEEIEESPTKNINSIFFKVIPGDKELNKDYYLTKYKKFIYLYFQLFQAFLGLLQFLYHNIL